MSDIDQEAETVQTYDRHADSWAAAHADRSANRVIVAKLQAYLPGGTVLEIGAGGGDDAELLTEAGYEYSGTDASAGMVRTAQRAHPARRFKQLSVYELDKLHRQFDGFWACAVLLHLPKTRIDEALRSIGGVTRPGGVGFISMKDGDMEAFERRTKAGRQEDRLFSYWRKEAFEQVLLRNGFEVIEYQYASQDIRTNWHWFIVRKGFIRPAIAGRVTA